MESSTALMAIPDPHMRILSRLRTQLLVNHIGSMPWLDAIPEDLRTTDPRLLYLPLLQREMIEEFGREVAITRSGIFCHTFGFMPVEPLPVTDTQMELMEHAPDPVELAESVDGGLVVIDEAPPAQEGK